MARLLAVPAELDAMRHAAILRGNVGAAARIAGWLDAAIVDGMPAARALDSRAPRRLQLTVEGGR